MEKTKARLSERIGYVTVMAFVGGSRWMPRKILYALLSFLGGLFYHTSKRRREITLENLKNAFPERSDKEIAHLARSVYTELSKTVTEILLMLTGRLEVSSAVVNKEEVLGKLDDIISGKNTGTLFLTAHFSNWELLAQFLSLYGYEMLVVGREGDNGLIDRKLTLPFRQRYGNTTVYKKKASIKVLKALKQKQRVGILLDQKVHSSEGVHVRFFGREVYSSGLVASLKQKLDITIIPIFAVRISEGKFRIVVRDPVEKKGSIEEMTQAYNDVMQEVIEETPSQWFWMHDRWKKS